MNRITESCCAARHAYKCATQPALNRATKAGYIIMVVDVGMSLCQDDNSKVSVTLGLVRCARNEQYLISSIPATDYSSLSSPLDKFRAASPPYSIVFSIITATTPDGAMFPVEIHGIDWSGGAFTEGQLVPHCF